MSLFSKLLSEIQNDNLILSGLGCFKVRSKGTTFVNLEIDKQYYENVIFYVVLNHVMPYDVIIGKRF